MFLVSGCPALLFCSQRQHFKLMSTLSCGALGLAEFYCTQRSGNRVVAVRYFKTSHTSNLKWTGMNLLVPISSDVDELILTYKVLFHAEQCEL